MKKYKFTIFSIILLASLNSWAINSKLSGKQIAQKVYNVETGDTAVSKVEMILISKENRRRSRRFISLRKEVGTKPIKSIIKFLSPSDIKNTALLTIDKRGDDSDQWIFLPALKKVRRISSSGKGKRFASSDIFYEDFNKREVTEDKHKRLRDSKYEGKLCYLVESKPKKKSSSSYKRVVAWIDPKTFMALQVKFYRKKKTPIKVLKVKKMKRIQGIWTILLSEFEDMIDKHKTVLRIENIKYNLRVSDKVFGTRTLESSSSLNSYLSKL